MKDLDNLKFITEDNQEYLILYTKYIDNEHYGYAMNLNNELDSMYVRIAKDEDGYFFEITNNIDIIKEMLKK